MFGARDSNAHIEEGIRSIVALLDNNDTMAKPVDGPQPGGGCRITMNRHLTPGCKTAILINGIPASGKSTITRLLAETFSLPVLTIDGIKEPFMARLAPVDRPMNRQLGCAAYEVIWSIVGASPASMVWLIDAWFGFQPRETLQRLLQQAGVEQVIEVWNHISGAGRRALCLAAGDAAAGPPWRRVFAGAGPAGRAGAAHVVRTCTDDRPAAPAANRTGY